MQMDNTGKIEVMIQCSHVEKTFFTRMTSTPVIRDLDLKVRKNEFVVLFGPGQCGKTTVLNVMAGLETATSGTVTVNGKEVSTPCPDRGFVYQTTALFPWYTVMQNVEYGPVAILEEKVKLALANGLTPIFCIGEVLEEREANKQNEVVAAQMESVFSLSAEDFSKIILAYEPVWAIGTGKTASPEQAQEIHAFIRSIVADKYGKEIADNTSILYGGSCKPSNAKELFSNPDVDGGLIGGAALKVSDFKGIIDAFNA